MRARFDGRCIKCGGRIIGWETSPSEACSDIGWRRRGETYGLPTVAWHTDCNGMPDDAAVIAELLAKKAAHPIPYKSVPYRSYPITVTPHPATAAVSAIEINSQTIETEAVTETAEEVPVMNPEQMQAMINAAVAAAINGKPAAAPVATRVKGSLVSTVSQRSAWWQKLEALIECGFTRILLVGPPGTGKSTTADRDGLRVTCHEDAGPESMIGTFIQKDGNTVWIDGPSVLAMKQGKRIVKDEIDHTSPECISLMYATLDDSPSIMLPTGEYIKATSGYQVVCTSNANPSDLPEAILDRIEAVIVADTPHELAVNSLKKDAGKDSASLVALMNNYYRGLSKDTYSWKGNPTLRRVRNFSKLLAAGLNKDVAAEAVFGRAHKEILSALTTAAI